MYPLEDTNKPPPSQMSNLQRIRYRCVDCSGNSKMEVRECKFTDCDLYPFRMGRNPNRRGVGGLVQNLKNVAEVDSLRHTISGSGC